MSRARASGSSGDSALHRLADEDLIPLSARGDAAAFQIVYERHTDAAYSLAYRMIAHAVGRGDRVMVTAEPKGGSRVPTSPPMMVARPA